MGRSESRSVAPPDASTVAVGVSQRAGFTITADEAAPWG
jgi:hypothetical protein